MLTELEGGLLGRLHRLYAAKGFPCIEDITVIKRTNTGAGRYTDLESDAVINLPDGHVGNGKYSYIEMEGQEDFIQFTALIESKKLVQLELSTIGLDEWDGSERAWRIADELNLEAFTINSDGSRELED